MLDAVKASNEYSEGAAVVIEEMLPPIRSSWPPTVAGPTIDIDWLAEGLGAYADYSFNKAHAASYGEVAYRSAYMRGHHPVDVLDRDARRPTPTPRKRKGRSHKTVEYSPGGAARGHVKVLAAARQPQRGDLHHGRRAQGHPQGPAVRRRGSVRSLPSELADQGPVTPR